MFFLPGSVLCGASAMKSVHGLKTDHSTTVMELTEEAHDVKANLEEQVGEVEQENKGLKRQMLSLQDDRDGSVKSLKSDHKDMQARLTKVEEQQNSNIPQITCGKSIYMLFVNYHQLVKSSAP